MTSIFEGLSTPKKQGRNSNQNNFKTLFHHLKKETVKNFWDVFKKPCK